MSIAIPDSVNSIGDYAFGECTSLTVSRLEIVSPASGIGPSWAATMQASRLVMGSPASGVRPSLAAINHDSRWRYQHWESSATADRSDISWRCLKREKVFNEATPTIYRKPEAKGWGDTWGGRPVID